MEFDYWWLHLASVLRTLKPMLDWVVCHAAGVRAGVQQLMQHQSASGFTR